jgi:plasmid stability protein
MATLHVRNVPDELYRKLQVCAEAEHRSLTAEVIDLLESGVAARDRVAQTKEILERLRVRRESLPPVPAGYAADLIREDRGEIEPR